MNLLLCSAILALALGHTIASSQLDQEIAETCNKALLVGQALITDGDHILKVVDNIKRLGLDSALESENNNVDKRGITKWWKRVKGWFTRKPKSDKTDAELDAQAIEVLEDSNKAESVGEMILDSANKALQLVKTAQGKVDYAMGKTKGIEDKVKKAVLALAKAAIGGLKTGKTIITTNKKVTDALVDSVGQLNATVHSSLTEVGYDLRQVGVSIKEVGGVLAELVKSGKVIMRSLLDAMHEMFEMTNRLFEGKEAFQKLGQSVSRLAKTAAKSGQNIATVIFRAAKKVTKAIFRGR